MKILSLFTLFILHTPGAYGFVTKSSPAGGLKCASELECTARAGAVLDRVSDPVKESFEDLSGAVPRAVPHVAVGGGSVALDTSSLRTLKLNHSRASSISPVGGQLRTTMTKRKSPPPQIENKAFSKVLQSNGVKKPSTEVLKAVDLNSIPRRAISIKEVTSVTAAATSSTQTPLTPRKEELRKVVLSAGAKKPSTEVLKAVDLSSIPRRALSIEGQQKEAGVAKAASTAQITLTPSRKEELRKVIQTAGAKKPSTEVLKAVDLSSLRRGAIAPPPALAAQMARVPIKKTSQPRSSSSVSSTIPEKSQSKKEVEVKKSPIFLRVVRKAVMPWTKL